MDIFTKLDGKKEQEENGLGDFRLENGLYFYNAPKLEPKTYKPKTKVFKTNWFIRFRTKFTMKRAIKISKLFKFYKYIEKLDKIKHLDFSVLDMETKTELFKISLTNQHFLNFLAVNNFDFDEVVKNTEMQYMPDQNIGEMVRYLKNVNVKDKKGMPFFFKAWYGDDMKEMIKLGVDFSATYNGMGIKEYCQKHTYGTVRMVKLRYFFDCGLLGLTKEEISELFISGMGEDRPISQIYKKICHSKTGQFKKEKKVVEGWCLVRSEKKTPQQEIDEIFEKAQGREN